MFHFKASLQDPHGRLSSWRADDDECCQWSGVTCDIQTGHLTELEVSAGDLVGEIGHSLVNLSYLNHLDLSTNSFNRTIPAFIGSMTELRYLDLSYNSLYGAIPPEFGNLTNLQVLYLGDFGRYRVETVEWLSHLSHLEELRMDGVSLAKANHWVDAILSLQKLRYLSLWGCKLSHVMYPYSFSFLNSSSSIHTLDLSWNMLDGIPKYFGNLCSLESLELSDNSAVVKFPDFFKNLSGCTSLALQGFYAPGSQFTGSLSDEIQSFSSLESLDLSDNHLNGSISEKMWEMPSLETLDISFNNLRVPSTYHMSEDV